jgi:hypothetical protein
MIVEVGHVHDYEPVVVRDYCHFQRVERHCRTCSHYEAHVLERNFDMDPMDIGFADPGCERCRELTRDQAGAWRYCTGCGITLGSGETGRCSVCQRRMTDA